jgi:DNA polymerase-3 subunit beta
MKVSVLKENLAKALSVCGRVVSTRGSLEILSHVMLEAEAGRLRVSATNLEVGINYWIGGKIEQPGTITVPARLFADVVSSLSADKIELEVEEMNLHVIAGNDKLTIKGISADEFPLIPTIKDKTSFSIKSDILKDSLNLVNFAAALDEARPVLSGVYLLAEEAKLTLAATDSYRLAEKTVILDKVATEKIEVVVPARTMMELSRIISDLNEEVKVSINDNQVLFAATDIEFTSRLIEGQFPNYKQIIPEDNDTKAVVSSGEFLNVLKVATLFARENANSVSLKVLAKGKIEVNATSAQLGDSNSTVTAEVTGKDAEIAFNGRYLLDVLNNLKEEKISFENSGKLSAGVIRPVKDKTYTYIIMPLRS